MSEKIQKLYDELRRERCPMCRRRIREEIAWLRKYGEDVA